MPCSHTLCTFDTIFQYSNIQYLPLFPRNNKSNINSIVSYITYSHITSFVYIVTRIPEGGLLMLKMTSTLIDPIFNATIAPTIDNSTHYVDLFLLVSVFSSMWLIIAWCYAFHYSVLSSSSISLLAVWTSCSH